MNTLILGNGFIGSKIAQKLSEITHVTVVTDFTPLVRIASVTYSSYKDLMQNRVATRFHKEAPLCVINASGRINHENNKANLARLEFEHVSRPLGILQSIKWRRGDRFVQLGTSEENLFEMFGSEHEMVSPYAKAKAKFWRSFCDLDFDKKPELCLNLKLFLIFGEGQKRERFLPFVIENCLSGKAFQLSDCQQQRDFLHIEDLIELIKLIMRSKWQGCKSLDVGSGNGTRLKDLVNAVKTICGQGEPIFGAKTDIRQELTELIADITLAKEMFGWKPRKQIFEELGPLILSK